MKSSPLPSGFTLIELLIVVAIVAILAAIAVPNFLQAQIRSKVARVKNDMRTIATGLEAYAVDYNAYPPTENFFTPQPFERYRPLTTPVAYLSTVPRDPFEYVQSQLFDVLDPEQPRDFYLYNRGTEDFGFGGQNEKSIQMQWSLTSGGPDLELEFPYYAFSPLFVQTNRHLVFVYDPTNGTVSRGEIFRRGGFIPYEVPGVSNDGF